MDDLLYLKTEIVRNTGSMDAIDDLIDLERSGKLSKDELIEVARRNSNAARRANPIKK